MEQCQKKISAKKPTAKKHSVKKSKPADKTISLFLVTPPGGHGKVHQELPEAISQSPLIAH
jgi:hypothetical protein